MEYNISTVNGQVAFHIFLRWWCSCLKCLKNLFFLLPLHPKSDTSIYIYSEKKYMVEGRRFREEFFLSDWTSWKKKKQKRWKEDCWFPMREICEEKSFRERKSKNSHLKMKLAIYPLFPFVAQKKIYRTCIMLNICDLCTVKNIMQKVFEHRKKVYCQLTLLHFVGTPPHHFAFFLGFILQ